MDQSDVMVRSFVIAAAIVLPYAIFKVRQVRAVRRAHEASLRSDSDSESKVDQLPALETVIGDIGFVVDEASRNGGAMLVVPHDVTVSDRPADPLIVDALVRDALARSNLVVTAELDSPEGRVLECTLLSTTR
ncbi:MAG: hypothetical protein R2735_15525 [Microthrixaceae bacterium]